MTVKGVDVSSYQSSTFSTKGLSFAFIKATEGTSYISPRMNAQAAHARAAGLVTGFYHFMHKGNPKGQAAYFVEKCASVAGDILACDWEPTSSGTPSNADKDTFIREVKRLRPGHKVVLYCDVSRWTGVDRTSYCGDGLWIADPNHPAGHPGVQHAWTFHQYGISGTDVDVANFPSKAALRAWATGSTPPPTPPKDTDMQLSDQVTIGQWIKDEWKNDAGMQDGKITVQTALGSGYGHARATHDATTQILAQLKAQTAAITTLAGLVGKGVDTAAVVAAVEKAIADAVVHVEIDTGDQT